jgi:hypothetical protein
MVDDLMRALAQDLQQRLPQCDVTLVDDYYGRLGKPAITVAVKRPAGVGVAMMIVYDEDSGKLALSRAFHRGAVALQGRAREKASLVEFEISDPSFSVDKLVADCQLFLKSYEELLRKLRAHMGRGRGRG